jgi:hypothetical protein
MDGISARNSKWRKSFHQTSFNEAPEPARNAPFVSEKRHSCPIEPSHRAILVSRPD